MSTLHNIFVNQGFYVEVSRFEDRDSYYVTPSPEMDILIYDKAMEYTKKHLVDLMGEFRFSLKSLVEAEDYILKISAYDVSPDTLAYAFKNFLPNDRCLSVEDDCLVIDVRCAAPLAELTQTFISSSEKKFREILEACVDAGVVARNTAISLEKETNPESPVLSYKFSL